MITHVVAWNILNEIQGNEKELVKRTMKDSLESLKDKISFIKEIRVETELLSSSNRDIMLFTVFQTEEDLEAYQKHEEHLKVGAYIKTVTCDRICLDYIS